MSKALRWSEKWFRFGLWIVAFVFASFLIGLGGTIVQNLPKVEHRVTLEDFIDKPAAQTLRAEVKAMQEKRQAAQDAHDQAQLKLNGARANSAAARDTFNNWLATRHATKQPDQDAELIARTQALDELKILERKALADVERQQQGLLDARQAEERAQRDMRELERDASGKLAVAYRDQELRVFAYRLALTLPLLGIAGWLFAKKRQSTWWPFVWGFIYFALFAFFVELVPYLPSYGGYVRYVVGIVITVLVGRYAIVALNRYLEKQKLAEAMPDVERRKELSYDTALARLAKKVCPGCERPVDLTNTAIDYCPHCGICLFDHCGACKERKSAFARFCHACGAAAGQGNQG
ncbi:zinc ribbon domain-containing protein [Ferribacterium limneticum]|uniref:zinc ribbon domain-containing protein n=1 Tax=Ferribacterium limneticum TaxID=76259 RepID=UPI001CF87137|nr:zinc ribbon domain-containing protein [Ferribacterium limneticum]UCV26841.1 serine endopeptidase [Ferribacterium limneticum]UCV30758.1 serine endopeptidase [Ferribacterium limneticum]